jgi:hypothetical protein
MFNLSRKEAHRKISECLNGPTSYVVVDLTSGYRVQIIRVRTRYQMLEGLCFGNGNWISLVDCPVTVNVRSPTESTFTVS